MQLLAEITSWYQAATVVAVIMSPFIGLALVLRILNNKH